MKIDEIRQLSKDDLKFQLEDALHELGNLRFQHSTHQLDNPLRLRTLRREVARMITILHEYDRAVKK
jgi:large subunit ribosomal protein L29